MVGSGLVTRRRLLAGGAATAAAAGLVGINPQPAAAVRVPQVAITWDGIWHSLYLHGLPLFKRFRVPGTAYIVTGRTGQPFAEMTGDRFCTWLEIADFLDAAWEISSHTEDHLGLPNLSESEIHREVRVAKTTLVERGYPAPGFAYPYNFFDARSINAVQRFHEYATAGPKRDGIAGIHTVGELYSLPRRSFTHMTSSQLIALTTDVCLGLHQDLVFLGHRVVTESGYQTNDRLAITAANLGRFLHWLRDREREGRLRVSTCRLLVRHHLLKQ